MGYFSWKDCKNSKKRVIVGADKKSYLLIPAEFGGGHYVESFYDGYGVFGGVDVFEAVATWNRDYLSEALLEEAPKLDQYRRFFDFEIEEMRSKGMSEEEIQAAELAYRTELYNEGLIRWNNDVAMINAFKNGASDEEMEDKYGEEYLREIGILIACYDRQNKRLHYPIKITLDAEAVYEDCEYSESDPDQGCY